MNIAVILSSILLSIALFFAPVEAMRTQEPMWPSFVNAMVLAAGVILLVSKRRAGEKSTLRSTDSLLFVALVAWGLVSVLGHVAQTKLAFLQEMLRGWSSLLGYLCAFLSMRYLARNHPGAAYLPILAAIGGAVVVSVIGLQEYMMHAVAHQATWRIFSTTENPDFLAGYLVMTIPVTIAAASAQLRAGRFLILFCLAIALEIGATLLTASRFAAVSIIVGLIVFGLLAVRNAVSTGRRLKFGRTALIATAVVIVGLAVVSKPLLSRMRGNANSGQFRVYTWRATAHMAEANPILGIGPGTYAEHFPQYEMAGFTRHAHDTYLQIAAEMGIPAALLTIALIAVVLASTVRKRVNDVPEAAKDSPFTVLAELPAGAHAVVLSGIAAAIAAGAVQNLIDSDLYVYGIGVTFWALAGLGSGMSAKEASTPSTPPVLRFAGAVVSAVAVVFAVMTGIAAADVDAAQQAMSNPSGGTVDAAADYRNAESMAPLDGKYAAELGYRVLLQLEGDPAGALSELRKGVELRPDSQNYLRLGTALQHTGDAAGGREMLLKGLQIDPNRIEILVDLAQTSTGSEALTYYRRIADQEVSPVGQVRAIGEVTEPRYAVGDSFVADDALAHGDKQGAEWFYRRAMRLLELYANEGGSSFPERMAGNGGVPQPDSDQEYATLFDHVAANLCTILSGKEKDTLTSEKLYYDAAFQSVIGDAYLATGHPSEAKTAYQNAQAFLNTCTYPKASALKSTIDSNLKALGQ